MLHAMQIGLPVARSHRNSEILVAGGFPSKAEPATLRAFNLATICGARAINMADNIGSLVEGSGRMWLFWTLTVQPCHVPWTMTLWWHW
jgi:cytosine/adenosine deaminase-related metal-dependent hydrolase